MLNARQNKVLWIPRILLLINLIIFLQIGCLGDGIEFYIVIVNVIQLILFIAFFILTFRTTTVSGVVYIFCSYFEPFFITPYKYRYFVIGLTTSMALAGILLIILPLFYRSKTQ